MLIIVIVTTKKVVILTLKRVMRDSMREKKYCDLLTHQNGVFSVHSFTIYINHFRFQPLYLIPSGRIYFSSVWQKLTQQQQLRYTNNCPPLPQWIIIPATILYLPLQLASAWIVEPIYQNITMKLLSGISHCVACQNDIK